MVKLLRLLLLLLLRTIVISWAVTDITRGFCLLWEGPIHVTTLSPLIRVVGHQWTASLCLASGFGAIYAVFALRSSFGVPLMLFQQSMLVFLAIGPVIAIAASQYADGILRPRAFLLADQSSHVPPVIVHIAAVIVYWFLRTNGGDNEG